MTLAELRALCERATKGPWAWTHVEPSQWGKQVGEVRGADDLLVMGQVVLEPADADFIAAARTWLPALIEKLTEWTPEDYEVWAAIVEKDASLFQLAAWLRAIAALARLDEVGKERGDG